MVSVDDDAGDDDDEGMVKTMATMPLSIRVTIMLMIELMMVMKTENYSHTNRWRFQ